MGGFLLRSGLFDDAGFKMYGGLFWPDFWAPGTSEEAQELVYDMVGLDAHQAAVSACPTLQAAECN